MNPIHTQRLTMREPDEADFERLRILHSDARVMATLSVDGRPVSDEVSRKILAGWLEHWRRYGFGPWILQERGSGDFIGYCGLRHVEIADASEVELLYAIRPEFWRMAYASEASRAALAYGFERAGLREIVAFTLKTNQASRGVMTKCGFRYERDIVRYGLAHVLYRISREDFAPR